ncbi:MAG: DUF3160 domain-containing protein [Chloroflexi bacterium]|nr:DUF3160 domain-containing protein [Chloroflexota bacterium]MBL7062279.1 DUF3160 domain-containing protein [Dehalococcoidia bacterium]
MKVAKIFTVVLVALTIVASGCAVQPPPTPPTFPPTGELPNPKLAMASAYRPTPVSFTPSSPPYSLPLDLTQIANSKQIQNELNLNSGQETLLERNGFVVIPWSGDDIVEPYKTLKNREIPIFVTTDTLLHLYHIQFNEILKRIEEEEFHSQLIDMSLAMLERAESDYQTFTQPMLKEAARRNVAYFAVALSLLQTPSKKIDFAIPSYVKNEVGEEIKNIEAHQGFSPSAIFNSLDSQNLYEEDYSQYVPRGHYTQSDILKSYFKTMMWYGRMAFLLKGGPDALIAEEDAETATIQASLISAELPGVKVGDYTAKDTWDRIYSVTSFFVGTADDLTPYEYLSSLKKVFGQEFAPIQLCDEVKMLELKAELALLRNPEIYGGSGVCVIYPPVTKEKLYECLAKTKGMRFMGQRFVPDSYMFQNLVSPAVGMYVGTGNPFTMKMTPLGPARCFPRGLDVMAVLGSDRAYEILKREGDTEYQGEDTSYDQQLKQLKDQFAAFTEEDWHRNLYWTWLYALKPLLDEFGKGYPAFMQTEAWQDKEMNTALASWAELRHDTILYAKQSYTPSLTAAPLPPKPLLGYIEPVPEFYARMLDLTKMTRQGLSQLGALSQEEDNRLASLESVLDRLLSISINELKGAELSQDDYAFIRDFGNGLENIICGVEAEGKETTIVADVHADTNEPPEVLEEAVGYVDLILVAYKVPDGRIIIGAGPTLSYYEFKQPINNRLTNEAWKDMLESGQAPPRPAWTSSFYQP